MTGSIRHTPSHTNVCDTAKPRMATMYGNALMRFLISYIPLASSSLTSCWCLP